MNRFVSRLLGICAGILLIGPVITFGQQPSGPTPCSSPADCDDGNPCTNDWCVFGSCTHTTATDGTPCPDTLFCTTSSQCQAGVCLSQSACADSEICLEQSQQCAEAVLSLDVEPSFHTGNLCYGNFFEPITVSVLMNNAGTPIVGGQFFLLFDATAWQVVSVDPGDAGGSGWAEVSESVDNVGGSIEYAVGRFDPVFATCGSPSSGSDGSFCSSDSNCTFPLTCGFPVTLATVTMLPIADNCQATIEFDAAHLPPGASASTALTQLTDQTGNLLNTFFDVTNVAATLDSTSPAELCPANETVNTDPGQCWADVFPASATCSDNCDTTCTPTGPDCAPPGSGGQCRLNVGSNAIFFEASDCAGNMSQCRTVITVVDAEPPSITCPANKTHATDPGTCEALVDPGMASCTDNCFSCSIDCARGDGLDCFLDPYPIGNTLVTWTATDPAGNASQCQRIITITDVESPQLICPPDVMAPTDLNVCTAAIDPGTATCSDNCECTATCTRSDGLDCILDDYPVGETTLTWSGADAAGNVIECNQLVVVSETQPPTLTCPAPPIFPTDEGVCWSTQAPDPAICDDNCGCDTECLRSDELDCALDSYPLGVTNVAWTSQDISGNRVNCDFDVTVEDAESPEITCPPIVDAGTDTDECFATVDPGLATCTDNCSCDVTCSRTGADCVLDTYPVGNTALTWLTDDGSGNGAQCVQTVRVTDQQKPEIICPLDLVAPTDPGLCDAILDIGFADCADNCACDTVTCTRSNGLSCTSGPYDVGTTSVTWKATDTSGNFVLCTQNITVQEQESPSISCTAQPHVVSTDPGQCKSSFVPTIPLCTDNCGCEVSCERDDSANCVSSTYPIDETKLTFTATDVSGNAASCMESVVVEDNEPPAIVCPADVTVPAEPQMCSAAVNPGMAVCSDNCGCTVSCVRGDGLDCTADDYENGTTTLTWTATDDAGNSVSCDSTVSVDVFEVAVSLELQGSVPLPQSRCLTFELFDCASGQSACTIQRDVEFTGACELSGNPCSSQGGCVSGEMCVAKADPVLCISEPECVLQDFSCMTVRDPLRTLRRSAAIVTGPSGHSATFDPLLGGNLDGNCFVDIVDFGILAGKCGDTPGAIACSDLPLGIFNADIDGSGIVDCVIDFSWISTNFFEWSDLNCCGAEPLCDSGALLGAQVASQPQSSITVESLSRMGLESIAPADLNQDGVIDATDVASFIQGARPPKRLDGDDVIRSPKRRAERRSTKR